MYLKKFRVTCFLVGVLTFLFIHAWREVERNYRSSTLVDGVPKAANQAHTLPKRKVQESLNLVLRGLEGIKDVKEDHTPSLTDTDYFGATEEEIGRDFSTSEAHQRLEKVIQALKSVLPSEYVNYTVNPCWKIQRQSSLSLACVPSFFLLGYPKCGTTELYNILTLHPHFAKPYNKEPHWWTSKRDIENLPNDFKRYFNWFNVAAREISADPQKITGDCSASTAWKHIFDSSVNEYPEYSLPYVFSKLFPHAKYVVIVRNPVTHLYSRFWYNCKLSDIVSSKLQENGPEIFELLAEQHIGAMHRCESELKNSKHCSLLDVRRKYLKPMSKSAKQLVRGKECGYIGFADSIYYGSLKEWFKFIPHNKILVLRTEDMASDTISIAQSVFKFLGMGEMDRVALEKGIQSFGHSNSQGEIRKGNLTMTETAKKKLMEFFKPYNKKLSDLLQDKRFLWE